MKSINSFSRNKFQSLSPAAQLNVINKLLNSVEESLSAAHVPESLCSHILECISWMDQPIPKNVDLLAIELEQQEDKHTISESIARFRASQGLTFTDNQLTILKSDGLHSSDPEEIQHSQKMIVILDNLRSVFNIGSIFRTAECLGLQAVWLCGISATPGNPALQKTAMGTSDRVVWRHFSETGEAVAAAKAEGYCVYALETTLASRSVFGCRFDLPIALLVGNESLGISPAILELCDKYLSLPVLGWKNSLNVGVAFAVSAYQIIFGTNTNETLTGD